MELKEFTEEVEVIFSRLENPVFAQEEKAKMYAQVLQLFGKLSSKDRQDYLTEEGMKCVILFKRIWEKQILEWLSDEIGSATDLHMLKHDEMSVYIEERSELARWFASIKEDMLEAELNLQEKE